MVNFDQGPGRNIDFCLITTGINIDPHHGGYSEELYSWIKNVISQKAEIHFENNTIREIFDTDVSSFLPGYSSTLRTVYQFLFGLVEHSNSWTEESLTNAFDQTPFPSHLKPQDGEYSIDFDISKENGLTLYQNQFIGSDVWVEQQSFYYSSTKPQFLDGDDGDIWLVSDGFDVELWIKTAFKWMRLNDYVKTLTPLGMVTYSIIDPGNSTNNWWLDLSGLNIRKFNKSLNTWEAFTSVTVSLNEPTGLSANDLWLKIDNNGKFFLFVFDGLKFNKVQFSKYPVQDRNTNSSFVGTIGNNNFILTCDEDALIGGPLSGGTSALKIKKDNILVQTMVDCINFIGPDLDVTTAGPGNVNVEHLPITTLPEQITSPSFSSQTGKIYTLDVGGNTELFYIDDNGKITQLTNNGTTNQNIFLDVTTLNAVAGQTVFSLPSTAKDVLSLKINGVDSTAWSFSSPSLTYFPIAGGYTIQAGDVVTVLFYG